MTSRSPFSSSAPAYRGAGGIRAPVALSIVLESDLGAIRAAGRSCGASYYHAVGNGTRAAPNPPAERFCSRSCEAWGARRRAIQRAARTVTIEVNYR